MSRPVNLKEIVLNYVWVCADTYESQKCLIPQNCSHSYYECWELSLGPLQEQQVPLSQHCFPPLS